MFLRRDLRHLTVEHRSPQLKLLEKGTWPSLQREEVVSPKTTIHSVVLTIPLRGSLNLTKTMFRRQGHRLPNGNLTRNTLHLQDHHRQSSSNLTKTSLHLPDHPPHIKRTMNLSHLLTTLGWLFQTPLSYHLHQPSTKIRVQLPTPPKKKQNERLSGVIAIPSGHPVTTRQKS